nr:hypothetical protein CFP56_20115 [Quercus suber]
MVVATLSECSLPSTVEDVEAMACRKAISFSIELGLQDVVFEIDSEIIYKHLVTDSICMIAFGHIIEDSRRIATSLRSVSFSHVRCNGNKVADKLAKLAKFLYEPQIWLGINTLPTRDQLINAPLKHLVTFALNVQSLKLFDSLFARDLKVDELNVTSSSSNIINIILLTR